MVVPLATYGYFQGTTNFHITFILYSYSNISIQVTNGIIGGPNRGSCHVHYMWVLSWYFGLGMATPSLTTLIFCHSHDTSVGLYCVS